MKTFDWKKAAIIISQNPELDYSAGLLEDLFCTSDDIFVDGEAVLDCNCYVSSIWATPTLIVNGEKYIDCFIEVDCRDMISHKWTDSALKILHNVKIEKQRIKFFKDIIVQNDAEEKLASSCNPVNEIIIDNIKVINKLEGASVSCNYTGHGVVITIE